MLLSRPSRARGLKLQHPGTHLPFLASRRLAGAWVETRRSRGSPLGRSLRAAAQLHRQLHCLTPLVGAQAEHRAVQLQEPPLVA